MRNGAAVQTLLMAAVGLAGPVTAALAQEDGPGRGVARISVINGDVSVRRGDSGDWVAAAVNAPLVVQDTIATGANSRAEVQFDYANMLRLGSDAEVRFTELEYRRYQMQVARGTVEFRVLRNSDADVDVSTPAVSVRPSRKGAYRITVRDDGQVEIAARSGEVEIYTPRGVERLSSGHGMVARAAEGGPEFQMVKMEPYDEFDRWNEQRDRVLERSASYRYVSPSIYGADDLDGYGRWVYDPPYGWVWVPQMGPGWAPYSRGRWAWEDWYGWTWVSYDPWGWAPYHYGRWYHNRYGWCWYPGVIGGVHYWSPALVAFFGFGVGNAHVGFGFGNVGWVPLAPHEPYYPWYGRGYYGGYRNSGYIDRSVHITNVNITNVYRNARVRDGVSGIDAGGFGRGNHNIIRVNDDQIRQAGLVRGQLPVAPTTDSLRYANREVREMPRTAVDKTRFYSRRQPAPVDRVPFAQQQRTFQAAGQRGTAPGVAGQPVNTGLRKEAPVVSEGVTRGGAQDNSRGWRRAADAGQPAAGQVRTGESPANARKTDSGWRRMNEAAAPQTGTQTPGTVRRNDASESGRGWHRFGEVQNREQSRPAAAPKAAEPSAAPRSSEPVKRSEPAQRSRPAERGRQNDGASSRSWQQFGEPGAAAGTVRSFNSSSDPHGGQPAQESSGFGRPQRTQSVQIAPPVVRERGTAGSGSASRGGSAPRMESAPRGAGGGTRSEARSGGSAGHASRGEGGRGGRSR